MGWIILFGDFFIIAASEASLQLSDSLKHSAFSNKLPTLPQPRRLLSHYIASSYNDHTVAKERKCKAKAAIASEADLMMSFSFIMQMSGAIRRMSQVYSSNGKKKSEILLATKRFASPRRIKINGICVR